jgi:hypothetical protein
MTDPLKDIAALQENVESMFTSIELIHGTEYKEIATRFFVLYNQIQTLESYMCQTSKAYLQHIERSVTDDPKDQLDLVMNREIAQSMHDTAHILASQCVSHLSYIIVVMEDKIPEFKDMQKNMTALMGRIKTDWINKGH